MASLCCIFLLKNKPADSTPYTLFSSTPSGNSLPKQTDRDSNNHDTSKFTRMKSRYTKFETANERTPINDPGTKQSTGATNRNGEFISREVDSYYGDVTGWEALKLLDFWLLMITFFVGSSCDKAFLTNTGMYLRSFRQEHHLHILMTAAPWCYLVTKVSVGIISDYYKKRIPRIVFLIVLVIIKIPLFFAFIFCGDNIIVMYVMTFILFISLGTFFLIPPILIAEYFGAKHYGLNYGTALLADGCLLLLLQFIIGLLYDMNVGEVATNTCYGLQCYYVSSGILCVLSIVTLITSVTLWVREGKMRLR